MIFIDTSSYDDRRYDSLLGKYIYDRPVDWSKQVENGARFAFIKCSEYVEDPGLRTQVVAARKVNLICGFWHYFHPAINAIDQANMQIAILKQIGLNWTGDSRTSDKIQLDLEVLDNVDPHSVMIAAASWYYEVNKAFPNFEKDIYVGWYFWTELISMADGSWAKDTKLWLPAYPLDPHPNQINPPSPFNAEQVNDLVSKAFTTYAMKNLAPWGQPAYRQITAYADSRFVPGHPAIKKVVDINVLNPDYFGTNPIPNPVPTPTPTPIPENSVDYITTTTINIRSQPLVNSTTFVRYALLGTILHAKVPPVRQNGFLQLTDNNWAYEQYLKLVNPIPNPNYPMYKTLCNLNVRQNASELSTKLGVIMANTIIYIDTPGTGDYAHFQSTAQFPNGGWVIFRWLVKL